MMQQGAVPCPLSSAATMCTIWPRKRWRGEHRGQNLLVDVREPNETDVERYPEVSICRCRSSIRPRSPISGASGHLRHHRSGNQSVTASLMAQAAGLPYDAHLAGGIIAWKALGLPTES